ncbi:MAG: VCBS repeat-containing protein, partial [Verrucomicrobiota bacterium]
MASEPSGLLPAKTVFTNLGARVVIDDRYTVTQGFRFVYWTLNGLVQTDRLGRAFGRLDFSLSTNTTIKAHYLPEMEDNDGDGIADWLELHWFGDTETNPSEDNDGDLFELQMEIDRDYHPLLRNDVRDGGVSITYGVPIQAIPNTNFGSCTIRSAPPGILPPDVIFAPFGSSVVLPDRYEATNGFRFVYWTLDGVVQTDQTGRAFGGFAFPLISNVLAEAHYVPEDADDDFDGIPDWLEWHWFRSLGEPVDPDGDGLDADIEFSRDYHPHLHNELRDGGFSMIYGSDIPVILRAGLVSYTIDSLPPGLLKQEYVVINAGTTVSVPSPHGPTNGFRFVYWTKNGLVQTDSLGRAVAHLEIPLFGNAEFVAHFVPEERDDDGDGLPDWFELIHYRDLDETGTDDTDGDGLDLWTEFERNGHPNLRNEVRDGGFSITFSESATIDLQLFPRVIDVLVDGFPEGFFSAMPPSTGTFSLAGNSSPAAGDWDGDGDLDLFVAGVGGLVHVFENQGSPVVMNLVDRTASFGGATSFWSNIVNPSLALGDWNGDGLDDLAVGGGDEIKLLSSVGHFMPGQVAQESFSISLAVTSGLPAFAEVTGDGWADLL